MEATKTRELSGEKAQRIIEAMRSSVARRGISGSTFEHVAREAGVSRGLLHYFFDTQEALLVEVVRRDSEHRIARLKQCAVGNYHKTRNWLRDHGFYLDAEQCRIVNEEIARIEGAQQKRHEPHAATAAFAPNPLMDESYYLPKPQK